jgi:hypothetical protein
VSCNLVVLIVCLVAAANAVLHSDAKGERCSVEYGLQQCRVDCCNCTMKMDNGIVAVVCLKAPVVL